MTDMDDKKKPDHKIQFMPLGMSIGISIGVGLGTVIDSQKKKDKTGDE